MTFCLRDILFGLFIILMISGLAGFCFWVGCVWRDRKWRSWLRGGLSENGKRLSIDIIRFTKDEKELMDFVDSHEGQMLGNSIVVERPKTQEGFFDFAHILFLNFWQSLSRLDGKYILHEDLSIPNLSMEKDGGDQIVLKWEQRIFVKKESNDAD